MHDRSRVYVAGSATLVGSALRRVLERQGRFCLLSDAGIDLGDGAAVDAFFARHRPEFIFVAPVRSGGIRANQRRPADLIRHNLLADANVIHAAHRRGAAKLLYVASSCVYPRLAPQPMGVESLHAGPLEPSSEAYATAKLAGIALCRAYRAQHGARFSAVIAADVFGPGDSFDPDDAHVVGALVRRFHDAKVADAPEVVVWGSGRPRRDFLFADDLGDACAFLMREYDGPSPVNVGSGAATSIADLAALVARAVGCRSTVRFDAASPDGAPEKVLDSQPLFDMGWRPRTALPDALAATYAAFLEVGGAAAHAG